ncbi:MAG: ATP-binding protein [Saccharofermentanales bacterium]|jgi:predicted AAA+ superfamily ATPase
MKKYLPRIVDKKIKKLLEVSGAVCIEGAKWCGKTSTSSELCNSSIFIGDPAGNFQNRSLAKLSPGTVLMGETPRLIDEWQEVPELWDAVRFEVDKRSKKGQFILTGSATPITKGILHSGAGRISMLHMRPMTLLESLDSTGEISLEDLCNGYYKNMMTEELSLDRLIDLIIRGGWPGNLDSASEDMGILPKEYIKSVINHDVYRMEGINRDTHKMELLLNSLARNESTAASILTLQKDIQEADSEKLDHQTITTYLAIFERLFLIDNIKAFSTNIRSSTRIKKSVKRHFVDPSLAVALLNLNAKKLIGDLKTLGFLFEALCIRDLRIYAESFGAEIYHYQDYKKREIDAVIELPDGNWCAFEIKLGANQIEQAAANLLKIKNDLLAEKAKIPSVLCVLCGLSNAAYLREDGVYVVPLTALKQ